MSHSSWFPLVKLSPEGNRTNICVKLSHVFRSELKLPPRYEHILFSSPGSILSVETSSQCSLILKLKKTNGNIMNAANLEQEILNQS